MIPQEQKELEKRVKNLEGALFFYANPENYFAIGIFPDPPCGHFINDFSETHLGPKPGKLARKMLGWNDE